MFLIFSWKRNFEGELTKGDCRTHNFEFISDPVFLYFFSLLVRQTSMITGCFDANLQI